MIYFIVFATFVRKSVADDTLGKLILCKSTFIGDGDRNPSNTIRKYLRFQIFQF